MIHKHVPIICHKWFQQHKSGVNAKIFTIVEPYDTINELGISVWELHTTENLYDESTDLREWTPGSKGGEWEQDLYWRTDKCS